jgi:hypothetical protein
MMASHAPRFGRASALPLSAVLASIPSYPRAIIERIVARLIEHLDATDGDADFEEDGEDCGGDEGEPDFRKRRRYRQNQSGPGCTISDSDFCQGHDDEGTHSYLHDTDRREVRAVQKMLRVRAADAPR